MTRGLAVAVACLVLARTRTGHSSPRPRQLNGLLTRPRVYRAVWVGKSSRSLEITFRLLPGPKSAAREAAAAASSRMGK